MFNACDNHSNIELSGYLHKLWEYLMHILHDMAVNKMLVATILLSPV